MSIVIFPMIVFILVPSPVLCILYQFIHIDAWHQCGHKIKRLLILFLTSKISNDNLVLEKVLPMTVHLIMLLIKNNRLTSQVWAVIFLSWHHAFHDYNQDHYNSILDHRMAQFHHSAASNNLYIKHLFNSWYLHVENCKFFTFKLFIRSVGT